jgi:transcriptional regulator GlxA family with amidase domain
MTRTIGFLVFPDFNILDLTGPLAAFEAGHVVSSGRPYVMRVLSEDGGLVPSSCALTVGTHAIGRGSLDTLVIVGGQGTAAAAQRPALIQYIRRTSQRTRRVCSICTGAFLLAAAGLLDGRKATTHWQAAERLRRAYPKIRIDSNQIYVKDGKIYTSGGVTAGIDLALTLVEEDLGIEVAQASARDLVVYHRRAGAQAQFSSLLELSPTSDRIRRSLNYARERLHERLSVDVLAAAASIGPRQFSRLFVLETGETPAKAIERLRTEEARIRISESSDSIASIARRVGFSDPERMRRAFLRIFGQPPQAIRRLARRAAIR